ncbi:hypothetical protein NO559_16570 [Dasania sp. GY-MA-18]|uniref:Delta-aminolevulinic acid dehydratase n=1 Tax=Dasania phycosphaerae TaxID=2950436 RepID=A0A9J6RSB4_9GAMM|nr:MULTISPECIES: hypothetical protein [Dasania]MCR8924389.1 hypothetical protein [Dasania sp. GY-MA-18]MCZ0867064.1 hypothetical protein [Dasania phycosphaerae]MCZ0870516.1 hypothetical protein [Dasania phycosphaerae]
MLKALTLFSLLTLSSQASLACQCLWQGSFNKAYQQADLIVSGKVLEHKGNAADFEINKILKGKEFLEIIRLWGDTGKLCRPNIYGFPEHSEWVLALHKITEVPAGGFNPNTPSFSYGRVGDYSLSNCGVYWLKYEHGFISGNLVNGPRWQWQDKKMNPVRIEVLEAYINGKIDDNTLKEAAKPQKALQDLMKNTLQSLE